MVLDASKTRCRSKTDYIRPYCCGTYSRFAVLVGALSREGETIIEGNKNLQDSQIDEQYAVNPLSIMIRLFAVSVLLVGGLDMMLAWRRGLEASWFFVSLLLAGGVLYAVSKIMQSKGSHRPQ